jgi:hypothetical protein
MALQRILVNPEQWENRCQTPSPPPVKTILQVILIAIINRLLFLYIKNRT